MGFDDRRKRIAFYSREILEKLSINKDKKYPEIRKYTDVKGNKVDIFQIKDIIEKGVTVFVTVGVSDHNLDIKVDNIDLGVEFIALSNKLFSEDAKVPSILMTCSSCIKNSNYECYSGAIFLDVIQPFYPNTDMKHILFTNLLPYMSDLKALYLEDKVVAWLLAVPISELEYEYSLENGVEALETELEKNNVDISDLDRKSIF